MIEFENLKRVLTQYSQAIADQYKTNLENSGRRASGNLITSVNPKVDVDGTLFEIELQLEDYWKYVEEGKDLENTMEEVDYEEQIQEALDKDILGCLDELLAILK